MNILTHTEPSDSTNTMTDITMTHGDIGFTFMYRIAKDDT